jgi:PleD family two-component response regulator
MCTILEQEEKGFMLGASEYLVKPFLQEDLIKAIEKLTLYTQNCKVLAIDDDPSDLRLDKKILQEHGQYRSYPGRRWSAGLGNYIDLKPDIIVLDLFMPEPNGFILLHRLQNDPELSNYPGDRSDRS